MVNNEGEGDKDKDKKEHVRWGVILHREVDVERGGKDEEYKHKRENWAWPDEYHDTKEDEEGVPKSEGNRFRYLEGLVKTLKKGHFCLLGAERERLRMRIDKIECYSETK